MKAQLERPQLWFPAVASLILVLVAVAFWGPLSAWFGLKGEAPQAPGLGEEATASLHRAFTSYEGLRAALAHDSLTELAERSQELAGALEQARAAAPDSFTLTLSQGIDAALALREAPDLTSARHHFGKLSEALVALASAAPSLQEGQFLFECPMAEGYQKWLQRSEQMENPYMGQRMLQCGSRAEWEAPAQSGVGDSQEVAHYTCPMHPSVKSATPGACPICGMDLVPVTHGELQSGVILVDHARRQRIGVKTAPVQRGPLTVSVTALGKVTWDETRLVDVTTRVMGWVQVLKVDAKGQQVRKGQVLFTLYSPDLLAAQQELLLAASRNGPGQETPLYRAAQQRLRLWGLTPAQLEAIVQRGEPMENVPLLSPASGYVLEKNVVAGASVMPGMKLYRIAPLDKVWVEAEVYEGDLKHVHQGQTVTVTLPFLGSEAQREGKVTHLYPWLDDKTRTGRVRVELANLEGVLKPDMYANVTFERDLGERLQVPASAIIYTGPRRLVFVDVGDDRLKPQEVKLGLKGPGTYEVLEGLKEGEVVVTSGNFLLAAEARLRSSLDEGSGGER